eukprot:jgi/Chlat1/4781/Chrsp308S08925
MDKGGAQYVRIRAGLIVHIEPVHRYVARLYFVDENKVQQPVPANVVLLDDTADIIKPFKDKFYKAWFRSYTLRINGEACLQLNNQKTQSILAPSGAACGTVDM